MRKLTTLIATALVLTVPAFSQERDETGCCGMMQGGMMSAEQLEMFQEHMQEMQDQMAQIRQEGDPERRRQLMREHMDSMQQGMGMMTNGMMAREDNANPAGDGSLSTEESMEERMQAMQHHMAMMQMMMDQMMQHYSEQADREEQE